MAESNVRLKHLQPSQYEAWLRRAEAANNDNNNDFLSWERMGREYRVACTAALEIRELLAQHDELLEALKAIDREAESWHEVHHNNDTVQCDAICALIPKMRTAIAHAEGRS